MTNNIKLFASASVFAVAMLGATPAFATGTAANTEIINEAFVNYSVGGVAQNQISASDTIRVDRKVTVSVVELGTTTTQVSPGQVQAATAFTVTNLSNATIDIGLTATDFVGGTAPHGGTDTFNPGAYTFYVETGGVAGFDATDTLVTYLDEVSDVTNTSRTVYVVTSIPLDKAPSTPLVNGDIAAVHLTGTAREGAGAGVQGAPITATGGVNGKATVETVLFDSAGTVAGDVANDGRSSDDDDYTVGAPLLSVTKLSRLIQDPVNLVSAGAPDNISAVANPNAKAIPGAFIEYCITVTNAAGGTSANAVTISDSLANLVRTPVDYVTAFGVYEGGSVAGGVCSGGTNTGTYTAGTRTVAGALGTIAPNTTRSVYFRVTIR